MNFFKTICFRNLTPLSIALLAIISYIPQNSKAQYFTGAIAEAVGGAGRGAAEVEETIFLNPASIAHAPSFTSGLFYHNGDTGQQEGSQVWGLNLVDNTEQVAVPGAISYLKRKRRFTDVLRVDEEYWQITVGNFIRGTRLSAGVNLIYLKQKAQLGDDYKQWNAAAGLHYNPRPDLGIGLTYHHMVNPGSDVPDHLKLLPVIGLGFHYIATTFLRVRLDASQQQRYNDKGKYKWHFGFESFPSDFMGLSFGFERDELLDRIFHTAGISFLGPKFSLHYGFKKNAEGTNGALHSVDLRVPIW